MDKKDFYRTLIDRYARNQATEEELEVFFALVKSDEMDEELLAYMDESMVAKTRPLWPRIAAAASVLLLLAAGIYLAIHQKPAPQPIAQVQDIKPGRELVFMGCPAGYKILSCSFKLL